MKRYFLGEKENWLSRWILHHRPTFRLHSNTLGLRYVVGLDRNEGCASSGETWPAGQAPSLFTRPKHQCYFQGFALRQLPLALGTSSLSRLHGILASDLSCGSVLEQCVQETYRRRKRYLCETRCPPGHQSDGH